MNVLFVTYDFPFPANSGGKNRAFNLLKYTSKKENIFLYSFVREDYSPDFNSQILDLGVKNIKVFKRKKLSSFSNIPLTVINNTSIFKTLYYEKSALLEIQELVKKEKIDIIHFESSYTGFLMDKSLRRLGAKLVLGTENIEYQLYFDFAKISNKFFLKPFIYLQANRLKNEELAMVRYADAVSTITGKEAEELYTLTGKECYVVGNGIDPNAFAYSYDSKIKKNILFVGNFSYFPNVDAVNFFYSSVFPKLDKDIRFTIIGKKCREKFKFDDRRVVKIDYVEDIISEYRKADVLIFPIRVGGGTNFKVLEAMSLGIPIIAHPERLEGLKAIPGEHFLPARTSIEYKEQIEFLYDNAPVRRKLSRNGRILIEQNYSWEGIAKYLLSVWNKVM